MRERASAKKGEMTSHVPSSQPGQGAKVNNKNHVQKRQMQSSLINWFINQLKHEMVSPNDTQSSTCNLQTHVSFLSRIGKL